MRVSFPVAAALSIGLSTAALADGYGPGPGYGPRYYPTWSGFYVGINGGYAWNNDRQFAVTPTFNGVDPQGGFGGGQIGYNWQSGPIVLGIEADIQGSGIGDKASALGATFKSDLDWFGTVRGRLGYAFGPSLLYFTGGFAYGGIKNEIDTGGFAFKSNDTAPGYTLGGGWEQKLSPALSLKVEYEYINLGRNDPTANVGAPFGVVNLCTFGVGLVCHDDAFHTVRLGLNYKFDTDRYAPLK